MLELEAERTAGEGERVAREERVGAAEGEMSVR